MQRPGHTGLKALATKKTARNEEKDTLIAVESFRGHSKIKIQSVASSAGGTAMMAMVAQPCRRHLNRNVNDEFDMEECYACATVAGTWAQSLTVIVSPLDMQGMIGMMQVLAGRAHTIHEVYRGGDNWQIPQLDRPQVEQSKEEVLSWRISHAGTWEAWPGFLVAVTPRLLCAVVLFLQETSFVVVLSEVSRFHLHNGLCPN